MNSTIRSLVFWLVLVVVAAGVQKVAQAQLQGSVGGRHHGQQRDLSGV